MGVENTSGGPTGAETPLELLKRVFPDAVLETSDANRDAAAVIHPGHLVQIMTFLKNDPRMHFEMLADLTAVDYLGREPRFDLVYHLTSVSMRRRLRIKVRIDEGNPAVESLTPIWSAANWLEREVWDMFGIRFAGHPDLKRILLYEEFQGHPLRKDYPIRKRQPLIGPKI